MANAKIKNNLHWQCKFLLFFALAMQIFSIFALAMQIFLIFCIGNANCFYFWHWKCKLGIILHVNFSHRFDEFFALAKQVFLIFCIAMQILFNFFMGNSNSFWFLHCQCDSFFIFCTGIASCF